jgi:hypothetical protein
MILFLHTGSTSALFRGKQALQKRELYNMREGEQQSLFILFYFLKNGIQGKF